VNEADAAQARLTRTIVWVALLVSQAVYVALLLSGTVPVQKAPSAGAIFPIALGAAATTTAIIAHNLWRRASGAGRPLHEVAPDAAGAVPQYLIAWVLDESVGIYGLVLGFLGFPSATWALFSAAGFLLLLVHRPRPARSGYGSIR
jgi:hypothetical protein